MLTSISPTLITSIPERFARLTSSTLGSSIRMMVFTEWFLSSKELNNKSTLLLTSHMMVEMEAGETCTQVRLTRSSKGSVLAQLYLSQQCRWSLRFPECHTKEPRPENTCNMQAHRWSTTHRHKHQQWVSAHPLFNFCWIFSSFKLKCILVAPHWKLFGSRVTQINKKMFFVFS